VLVLSLPPSLLKFNGYWESDKNDMLDHTITKSLSIEACAVHRMVAELCSGSTYQFLDRGESVIVRTTKNISANGKPVISPDEGTEHVFFLRASVAGRRKKTNIYPASANWRYRKTWLEQQGDKSGFDVLDVHVKSRHIKIEDRSGRRFSIDCSDFTGVLRVIHKRKLTETLHNGIGRIGQVFGIGMLIIGSGQ
jgi:hypothetical protein